MVEATQGAAVTATSKKSAFSHFQAQLDLKSSHDDAIPWLILVHLICVYTLNAMRCTPGCPMFTIGPPSIRSTQCEQLVQPGPPDVQTAGTSCWPEVFPLCRGFYHNNVSFIVGS